MPNMNLGAGIDPIDDSNTIKIGNFVVVTVELICPRANMPRKCHH